MQKRQQKLMGYISKRNVRSSIGKIIEGIRK